MHSMLANCLVTHITKTVSYTLYLRPTNARIQYLAAFLLIQLRDDVTKTLNVLTDSHNIAQTAERCSMLPASVIDAD